MSDHLPECSRHGLAEDYLRGNQCICARLRWAEQRTLKAAREAVAVALASGYPDPEAMRQALAAIDAVVP
jgi:hypothetical protein